MSKIAHIVALKAADVLPLIGGPDIGLTALCAQESRACPLLDQSDSAIWIGPRPQLELDPTFVQPIPYIIVTDGKRVLSYIRSESGGEGRLHNKVSIGFGGHIDTTDQDVDPDTGVIELRGTLYNAAQRELAEELALPQWILDQHLTLSWTHAIHSAATEVDSVHLGIVCEASLEGTSWRPDPETVEDAARELSWLTWAELAALIDPANPERAEPETWTRLLIEHRTAI